LEKMFFGDRHLRLLYYKTGHEKGGKVTIFG